MDPDRPSQIGLSSLCPWVLLINSEGGFPQPQPLEEWRYQEDNGGGHYFEELDSIYYLSTPSSSKDVAALFCTRGPPLRGAQQGGTASVFTVSGATCGLYRRSAGTNISMRASRRVIRPSDEHACYSLGTLIPGMRIVCVSAMDVVTFRWDGRRFAQISLKTELSAYGREQEGCCLADSPLIVPRSLPR